MIIVGILLAICAAGIGTTSKQLIAASEHFKKPWLFHLGAGMNIALGPLVDASAYAFAPQVIVAPFACLDVIFNALTAPYTLDFQAEKRTSHHVRGTLLVALGASCTPFFANVDNHIYGVRELEAQLFFRPTSVAYLVIELSAMICVNWALRKKMLSPNVRGIALGVVAGILMGNVFFLKGLIGIIQITASTGQYDAWLRPTPYILATCAGGGAVLGHIFMRKGLGEYKGVFMVTIFEGAHISAACFSGCVVMEEMAGAPWWRYMLYWTSVAIILLGMLVINKAAADSQIEGKREGKFHIAQSERLKEVPEDKESLSQAREDPHCDSGSPQVTPAGSRPVGRTLEEFDAETPTQPEATSPKAGRETELVSRHVGFSAGASQADRPKARDRMIGPEEVVTTLVAENGSP